MIEILHSLQRDLNDYIWIHSLGLEILKWKNIPIRFGISSGNKFNHRFSFGSGLYINNIRFDIGASWIGSRQLYHANGFDFGISLSINNYKLSNLNTSKITEISLMLKSMQLELML